MDSLSNFPESIAAAAPLLLAGIIVVAACLWFVRSARKDR
jgi:hypothetical protein